MATTIVTKNSSTASAVPTAGQLVQGELAVNVADKRLYTEDNAGAVVELGTNPSTLTVTGEITANGGIALGDNDYATFGAGDDLQIFHDGSNSYVQDAGTGDLIVRANNLALQATSGEQYAAFVANGSASLFYDNAQKLATTATGIDVTGTATMDGLTVDGVTTVLTLQGAGTAYLAQKFSNSGGNTYLGISNSAGGGFLSGSGNYSTALLTESATNIAFGTANVKRQLIASNGDISFYEDTGTTAKLFWDASAESLGIGTSSPSTRLEVGDGVSSETIKVNAGSGWADVRLHSASANGGSIYFNDGADAGQLFYYHVDDSMRFHTATTERMRIDSSGVTTFKYNTKVYTAGYPETRLGITDSNYFNFTFDNPSDALSIGKNGSTKMTLTASGNVGIGTSSPSGKLHVQSASSGGTASGNADELILEGSGNTGLTILSGATSLGNLFFADSGDAADGYINYDQSGRSMRFGTATSERMRIDSSGNVGIGCTPASKLDIDISTDARGSFSSSIGEVGSGNFALQVTNSAGSALKPLGFRAEDIRFATGSVERMRIDSSGNVGIGTSSPAYKLNVAGDMIADGDGNSRAIGFDFYGALKYNLYMDGSSDADKMHIRKGTTNVATFDASGNVGIGTTSINNKLTLADTSDCGIQLTKTGSISVRVAAVGGGMAFGVDGSSGNTERMRIDSSGNLLVGTTSVGGAGGLSIRPNASTNATQLMFNRANSTSRSYITDFQNNGTTVGTISYTNTSTDYATSSDQRLKENIADADDAGSKIDAIQVRQYDWKVDGSHQDYGMVAQELQLVAPEAVSGDADSEEMMGVDYSKLVPMLIKEIQSLRNRVAQLEA